MTWSDEWTQVLEDLPLDRGREACEAWLTSHGVLEAEREEVVRVEIVRTGRGDVLRLLVRSGYLQSRGLEP